MFIVHPRVTAKTNFFFKVQCKIINNTQSEKNKNKSRRSKLKTTNKVYIKSNNINNDIKYKQATHTS